MSLKNYIDNFIFEYTMKQVSAPYPMKSDFSIQLPCKPYVKHYLTQNFGDPVNLYQADNPFLPLLKLLLHSQKRDKYPSRSLSANIYSDSATIVLSEDDFLRVGFELTRNGAIVFNKEVERTFKHMMHVIVAINFTFYGNLEMAIDRFTLDFDIPEDTWPHESIRKDFMRHASVHRFNFKNTISENLTKVFLTQLSEIGTLGILTLKEYERNTQKQQQPRGDSQSLGYTILSGGNSQSAGKTK